MIWRQCPECKRGILKTEKICPECGCKLGRAAGAERIGQIITFGTYPQGPNGEVAPIEWQVLDVEYEKALLISKYGLDCKLYNETLADVTWETCTLRAWLNGTFLSTAFSEEEQKKIIETTVAVEDNMYWVTDAENDTKDMVFLLSIQEMREDFALHDDWYHEWECVPTDYSIGQGCRFYDEYREDGQAACVWWLRSPGRKHNQATFVGFTGIIDFDGHRVNCETIAVRPALWVELD